MNNPVTSPAARRLPPRMPFRRLVLKEAPAADAIFSYCSSEDVESLTKICYTFVLQSTGRLCPKTEFRAEQRLFQN